MSDPIVGIDLGTSTTVVAHASTTGAVQVLADGGGFKIHPVSYTHLTLPTNSRV